MAKSKFFRVAVAGMTATDGRTIERSWLEDIAVTYNRATYGARINMEHIRGFSPDAPFNAYGDVLSVRTEEVDIDVAGKTEKRLALFAEIEPTEALIKLTKARQKIYTSIEVAPNFAGTGKAGLVGLAVTDTPASLGTDILAFSATKDNAAATQLRDALDARKADKANVFSAAHETAIEIIDDTPAQPSALERFTELMANALGAKKPEPESKPDPKPPVAQPQATDFAATMAAFTAAVSADRQADKAASDSRFNDIGRQIGELKSLIEKTPQNPADFKRPVISGGPDHQLTDC